MTTRHEPTSGDGAPAVVTRRELIGGAAAGVGLAAAALTTVLPAAAEAQVAAEGSVFTLEIDGFFTGDFQYAAGLGSETVMPSSSGDTQAYAKVPGRLKWGPVELKRGITSQMNLYEWRKLVEDGNIVDARKDGSITLLNTQGSPVATYSFRQAWPSKYSGVSVSEDASRVWEWVTLEVESLIRVR
jgi:phage tail-like protein